MSEHPVNPEPASRPPAPGPGRKLRVSQQRRNERSVLRYISMLFAAAFVLLLITYMMDRRQYQIIQSQNEDQISSLLQTVSAVQSLQGLQSENANLTAQLDEVQGRLEELEQRVRAAESALQKAQSDLEKQTRATQAMDWFWQINEAYVRGRYTLARQLIDSLVELGLADALPQQSATENDRFSPALRYQEIYDALF